ncbi:peptidoglycan-binding protein [Leclercia adecarboxylata]|uniref:peptidoglycan-binding protein n=1 Tax=Leclercia adecarboxylata TaxID=83655 RepID=UPI00202A9497|nr:peptidoglycan-binding protein [Leclercia adecarboxylata]URO00608.1 peptidoglycan-binding protein [Leclercia adecarboxylata]
MYLSHFKFAGQPFSKVTHAAGKFFVPYHQDVFGMLKDKSRTPGIMGLFSDDESLLSQFSSELLAQTPAGMTLNAFPKLSASALLYKLNPKNTDAKNRLHAIDAVLRQWHEVFPRCRTQGLVLNISAIQAMRDNGWEILGMLLTRAQECDLPLTILLTGTPDQEARLMAHSGLGSRVHTRHTLRALTGRECSDYIQAHIAHQGADVSPFTPARIRRMQALTKGSVSQLNALAHLALLAAWTERAGLVGTRHLRLAAGEVLPVKRSNKRLAAVGLFACVVFAACGWHFSPAITAALPFKPPVPARWIPSVKKTEMPVQPAIEREVVNQPDAMHQLYTMWGYDTSADEALCQNAGRVNLQCKQGSAPLMTLEQEGYPWISELKTGDHLNYAVVARVGKDSLDLLMNNRTWQVSRNWFTQHATGNYTLLHRLTPGGKEAVGAGSDKQDLDWVDTQLSLALHQPETHAHTWTQTLVNRTREFQQKMHLHVDGLPGKETLMQLMRVNNTTPAIVTPLTQGETH